MPKALFHKGIPFTQRGIPFTQRPFHKQTPFTPPFQYGALTHTSEGKSLYKPVCKANPFSTNKTQKTIGKPTKAKTTKQNKTIDKIKNTKTKTLV